MNSRSERASYLSGKAETAVGDGFGTLIWICEPFRSASRGCFGVTRQPAGGHGQREHYSTQLEPNSIRFGAQVQPGRRAHAYGTRLTQVCLIYDLRWSGLRWERS